MTHKVYIVTDLGPGDGGKGSVVHKIATMMNAHTIVKVGGAQGSHGVCTSRGERHSFSQWGCGTFEGAKTHISSRLVVSPEGLLNEAAVLQYQHGIHDPFGLLTIDKEAICATAFHGIASRLKEMARGNNPRGTIGTGVGEAYRYAQLYPNLIIRVGDLSRLDLKDLLTLVRNQIRSNLDRIIKGEFLPDDRDEAQKEISLFYNDDYLRYTAERFREVSRKIKIVDHDYLGREVLSQDGVVVVESSHGVLTDNHYGFQPHTSALRTLPCFTHAMLKEAGYRGEIVNLGVFRAYAIRHGAGPLPTSDPKMAEHLLPGSHKEKNRYQGEVRVGPLDLVLLRYAIEVCGGSSAFDGLAMTWFDQIMINGEWRICDRYAGLEKIDIEGGMDDGRFLNCKPEIRTLKIPAMFGKDELYSFCSSVLNKKLGIPIRMISFGPTERDKVCK